MSDESDDDLVVPVAAWTHDPKLLGPMMGVIAGFNCLAEALVTKGIIEPAPLAELLEARMRGLLASNDATWAEAARVLEMMRSPLRDAERAATRRLLSEPPSGSA